MSFLKNRGKYRSLAVILLSLSLIVAMLGLSCVAVVSPIAYFTFRSNPDRQANAAAFSGTNGYAAGSSAGQTPTVTATPFLPVTSTFLPSTVTAMPSATPTIPPTATLTPTLALPTATLTPNLPEPQSWNGEERVTILVMGVDQREDTAPGDIPRTDTMILLTVDPVTKTAGMLSIPRDLWTTFPETGTSSKINTAYPIGEINGMPGGGPGYTMLTISRLMGVRIDHYVVLNFQAFVTFINAMGGLDMHIKEEIKVDPIGSGNTVTLYPGVQTLTGEVALAYARNRHTIGSDFDRINRQQEVILAIRKQILDLNMLPGLVAKSPLLYRELVNGIRTDLSLEQIIRLAWLAAQIPEENIQRSAFNPYTDLLNQTLDTEAGRQSVLILVPESITRLRQELFPEQ